MDDVLCLLKRTTFPNERILCYTLNFKVKDILLIVRFGVSCTCRDSGIDRGDALIIVALMAQQNFRRWDAPRSVDLAHSLFFCLRIILLLV